MIKRILVSYYALRLGHYKSGFAIVGLELAAIFYWPALFLLPLMLLLGYIY